MKVTLNDIAGFCPEEAVWKMLSDLCRIAEAGAEATLPKLCPARILVDGKTFLIDDTEAYDERFDAPELTGKGGKVGATELVWSLGALTYYASTKQIIFGGRGGSYQREFPHVALPSLQKMHQGLTPLMKQCLCSDPGSRISLEALSAHARSGYEECLLRQREQLQGPMPKPDMPTAPASAWPETMTEI